MNISFVLRMPVAFLAVCLLVFVPTVNAGLFDDIAKSVKSAGDKIKRDVVNGSGGGFGSDDGNEDEDDFTDSGDLSSSQSMTVASRASVGMTVSGEMSNSIQISPVSGYFRGGQFNAKRNDFGLILSVWKPKHTAGAKNKCYSYVYDQFGRRNDPALKKLQAEYVVMRGAKIVLENVRMAKGNRICVYSKLRFTRKPSKTEQAIASKGGDLTISGEMTNQIQVVPVGTIFRKQFGVRYDSYGLKIKLKDIRNVALAGGRCNTLVHDQFGKKKDSALNILHKKHMDVRGKKVVLENVRMAKHKGNCVYSAMHVDDAPPLISVGSIVSGTVGGVSYGLRRKEISQKMKAFQRNIPVVAVILRKVSADGFNSKKCKYYYSAIEEDTVTGVPDEIGRLKLNVSRVTLKDVSMLNERKGECTFDHYKSFGIAKVGGVIKKAEAEAKSAGAFSFKYHMPQITAAMEGRSREEIFSIVKRLKKYGYGVNISSYRDFVSAVGQIGQKHAGGYHRQNQLIIKFGRDHKVNAVTSSTLIQESMADCDVLSNTYANKLINKFGLKPVSKNKKGQVGRVVKGSSYGTITYGRSECSVTFTTNMD